MSFFGKLEDKLINFLTVICWWFDLHFNLKSKHLVAPVMFFVSMSIHLFLLRDFVLSLLIFLQYLVLNNLAAIILQLYKNASLSPNPNRHNTIHKVSIFSPGIFCIVMKIEPYLFGVAYLLTMFSWFYVLCTEPMPPAEKEKRMQKIETAS